MIRLRLSPKDRLTVRGTAAPDGRLPFAWIEFSRTGDRPWLRRFECRDCEFASTRLSRDGFSTIAVNQAAKGTGSSWDVLALDGTVDGELRPGIAVRLPPHAFGGVALQSFRRSSPASGGPQANDACLCFAACSSPAADTILHRRRFWSNPTRTKPAVSSSTYPCRARRPPASAGSSSRRTALSLFRAGAIRCRRPRATASSLSGALPHDAGVTSGT